MNYPVSFKNLCVFLVHEKYSFCVFFNVSVKNSFIFLRMIVQNQKKRSDMGFQKLTVITVKAVIENFKKRGNVAQTFLYNLDEICTISHIHGSQFFGYNHKSGYA